MAVVVVLVLAIGLDLLLSSGRIHPRVSIAGVDVGSMSAGGATATLDKELGARIAKPVKVVYGDSSWDVTAKQIGLSFDDADQTRRAMEVGRAGGFLSAVGARIDAIFTGVDLAPTPVVDEEKLNETLDVIAESTDVPAKNASVVIEGTTPQVVEGKDGHMMRRDVIRSRLLAAFWSTGNRVVKAPVVVDRMHVDAAEAGRAAKVAEGMLDSAVTITFDEKSWKFPPADIAKWIDIAPSQEDSKTPSAESTLTVVVSPELAEEPILKKLGSDVGRPAKNARFKTAHGSVTIIPSEEGIGPDIASLSDNMTRELKKGGGEHSVALRTTRVQPKITTEKARGMGVTQRISTFSTTYEPSNRPRVNNIHLLGNALDGTLIKPGGTFSFNGAAGQRTAAKGYQEANAIVKGRLVPQLGGGVCQVGTTVFNAVFLSGLPVVERHNHSFYISHYPDGRDATVSWGGPDLKFKNETDHWVLVSVSYTSSSITVSLYGTDPGYDVTAEKGKWTNIREAGTEEIKDPKLEKGSKVVEEQGVSGRSIVVKRIVEKDGKVVRTDSFFSNYRPKAQIVRVGTKKVEQPETDTTTSTTTP
ncbi:MAG TPA: VanW family protein [Coriobacteriia bacterium]|nr:VanW family protein [Coriobacteriia bacterium]